jgi:hypothetical protein
MSNVLPHVKYKARIAMSINTDPNNVYRKNFIAAYSRWGPPHMPIRKYMGRSITSQNMKKRKKSSDRKTPITPVSKRRKSAKYPL